MKFKVTIKRTYANEYEVEADSKDDAEEIAIDRITHDDSADDNGDWQVFGEEVK